MSLNLLSDVRHGNRSTLTVGVSIWQDMKPNCLHKSNHCNPGAVLLLLQTIADLLKLDLVIKFSEEPGCGKMNNNGNWTGLFGMLQRNEIEITGNLCLLEHNRTNISWLSHSYPVMHDKQSYIIRAPTPAYKFSVGAPFDTLVWSIIFAYCFAFFLYFLFYYSYSTGTRFNLSFIDIFSTFNKIAFGLDPPQCLPKHILLVFDGFIGFITILYSTYITAAILSPVYIERPFTNYSGVIDSLATGQFQYADYHKEPAPFRCFEKCEILNEILHTRKYSYFNPNVENFTENFMNGISNENSALLMAHSDLWIRFHLNVFKERHKIWLLTDDDAGDTRFVYFYHKNFSLANAVDMCLILMGSFKDNFRLRLFGLADQAVQAKVIKGEIPEKLTINWQLFQGPFEVYLMGLLIGVVVFVIEKIYFALK